MQKVIVTRVVLTKGNKWWSVILGFGEGYFVTRPTKIPATVSKDDAFTQVLALYPIGSTIAIR
jgi:hypothetical protein